MPSFIKLDVEGFEVEALAGLTRPVPALSFEFTTIQRDLARGRHRTLRRARLRALTTPRSARARPSSMPNGRTRKASPHWLAALPMAANSGDIYACRRASVDRRPSAPGQSKPIFNRFGARNCATTLRIAAAAEGCGMTEGLDRGHQSTAATRRRRAARQGGRRPCRSASSSTKSRASAISCR